MSLQSAPPRWTGKPPEEITLTGKLFAATRDDQPIWLTIAGDAGALYLACFSSVKQLRALHNAARAPYHKIKRIDDGLVFLDSLPRRCDGAPLKVILDPNITAAGTVRWKEIKWN